MILTGIEIKRSMATGDICIVPFRNGNLNPNSYNFCLGDELLEVVSTGVSGTPAQDSRPVYRDERGGFLLLPQQLYLGVTREVLGSRRYVTTLLGRSSMGRLGLFLNVTADLGHVGSAIRWTLELKVVQPLRIYPGMAVGQVAFWAQAGTTCSYRGRYQGDVAPVPTRDPLLTASHQIGEML